LLTWKEGPQTEKAFAEITMDGDSEVVGEKGVICHKSPTDCVDKPLRLGLSFCVEVVAEPHSEEKREVGKISTLVMSKDFRRKHRPGPNFVHAVCVAHHEDNVAYTGEAQEG